MKLKSIAAAAAVVAFASGAYAAGGSLGTLDPGDSVTFGDSVTGAFTDIWTFDLSADSVVAASVTNVELTVFSNVTGGITDFAGKLNGVDMVLTTIPTDNPPVTISVLVLSGAGLLSAGSYTLEISGSGITGPSASYGGNLTVSAIPEPETYAMMLAGLSAIGFMAARRRRQG